MTSCSRENRVTTVKIYFFLVNINAIYVCDSVQDSETWPVRHSVEIPVLSFIHLEELSEDNFFPSAVDNTYEQNESNLKKKTKKTH